MTKDTITLSDGGGGKQAARLIREVFLSTYGNAELNKLEDAAEIKVGRERIAFTTDSYTVKPVFFPGGDIGTLAICGTINDLFVKGAYPLALATGFILEEGFPVSDLKKIAVAMHAVVKVLNIPIITGDTKVVTRGEVDGIFINTSGIGMVQKDMDISCAYARPGDDIIVSGAIAEHGMAILNAREQLGFSPEIKSDVAPLCPVLAYLSDYAVSIHAMRDPTRGGLAGILNEIALVSKVTIKLWENKIPVTQEVQSCCSLLGIDPLYVANEGKFVMIVESSATAALLRHLRKIPVTSRSAVIGKVQDKTFSDAVPPVSLETHLGVERFLPLLEGDPLPRIC